MQNMQKQLSKPAKDKQYMYVNQNDNNHPSNAAVAKMDQIILQVFMFSNSIQELFFKTDVGVSQLKACFLKAF